MQPTAQNQIIPQMEFIRDCLLTLANSVSGQCILVSNLRDMWEQAAQDSQAPLIYVCYSGETPWSSNSNLSPVTYRVTRNWTIGVKQGRGFQTIRGSSLENFLPFVEQVRDTVRAMFGVSQEVVPIFNGIEPWSLGTQIIDGYLIRVSVRADLPPILEQSDE